MHDTKSSAAYASRAAHWSAACDILTSGEAGHVPRLELTFYTNMTAHGRIQHMPALVLLPLRARRKYFTF